MSERRVVSYLVAVVVAFTVTACDSFGASTPSDRARAERLAQDPAFLVDHAGFDGSIVATTVHRSGGTNDQSTSATRTWRATSGAVVEITQLAAEIATALQHSGWAEGDQIGGVRVFHRGFGGGAAGAFSAEALLVADERSVTLTMTA